jgi:hypothetical protein
MRGFPPVPPDLEKPNWMGYIMPTIDNVGPYRVFFYSNEHEPEHVHIERDGGEVKIEFFTGPNGGPYLKDNKGMKNPDVRSAMNIVKEKRDEYFKKWNEFYGKPSA